MDFVKDADPAEYNVVLTPAHGTFINQVGTNEEEIVLPFEVFRKLFMLESLSQKCMPQITAILKNIPSASEEAMGNAYENSMEGNIPSGIEHTKMSLGLLRAIEGTRYGLVVHMLLTGQIPVPLMTPRDPKWTMRGNSEFLLEVHLEKKV